MDELAKAFCKPVLYINGSLLCICIYTWHGSVKLCSLFTIFARESVYQGEWLDKVDGKILNHRTERKIWFYLVPKSS